MSAVALLMVGLACLALAPVAAGVALPRATPRARALALVAVAVLLLAITNLLALSALGPAPPH